MGKGKANYGIDAPPVLRRFVGVGAAMGVMGLVSYALAGRVISSRIGVITGSTFVATGGWFLFLAGMMVWGSKVGKLMLRDRVVEGIAWRGDERVLDVGCGHGLMLIGAARRLTSGRAIGMDIWQQQDQAGNSAEATLENIRLEKVEGRATLISADARAICFAEESFDVVLSSWALHNIYDADGRAMALREIARVLKPGGRVAIVDIHHTREYVEVLKRAGLERVERRGPSFLFIIPSYVVMGVKGDV